MLRKASTDIATKSALLSMGQLTQRTLTGAKEWLQETARVSPVVGGLQILGSQLDGRANLLTLFNGKEEGERGKDVVMKMAN